jgi:hypothetical protein
MTKCIMLWEKKDMYVYDLVILGVDGRRHGGWDGDFWTCIGT